jgi:hypothetical protein
MRLAGAADRQLPVAEEIFLDHIGHFVRDHAAASRALVRAGFAPTPVSVQTNPGADGAPQPTGTGNITAMLRRGYVEALFKTADTPLGREFDTALTRHTGVHLVAFAVTDAAKAHRRLGTAGLRTRPLVELRRPVDTATGRDTAAFTVARVEPGEMPEGRIQMLTHHSEQAVWQPRWITHPNGAAALTSVTIAVPDVAEAAARYERFTSHAAQLTQWGRSITLDRGRIDLVTAATFAAQVPDVAIPALPFIGAYGIEVASLSTLAGILQRAELPMRRSAETLVALFPAELGHGAWLFTEAEKRSAPAGHP